MGALGEVQGGADSTTELHDSFTPIPGARKIKTNDHFFMDNEHREGKLVVGEARVFTESQRKLFKIKCHIQKVLFQTY